uniref:Uncharacterized protein n=1 Tax=Anguilla anguilla TaxID=7936 RepID=A0A0E9SC27_ANGAN
MCQITWKSYLTPKSKHSINTTTLSSGSSYMKVSVYIFTPMKKRKLIYKCNICYIKIPLSSTK